MDLSQTKIVGLTMELDLKTREYKKLCEKLDKLKENKIDPNDERLLVVKDLFQKNHDEIAEINRQIKELKETEELIEKQKSEQYDSEKMFERKNNNISKSNEEENMNLSIVETKKSGFARLIEKIKSFFKKHLSHKK